MKSLAVPIALAALLPFAFADDEPPTPAEQGRLEQAEREAKVMELGRKYTKLFYEQELDPIWERCDDAMRAVFGDVKGLSAFHFKVRAQLGKEDAVLEESVTLLGSSAIYERLSRFTSYSDAIQVVWSFDGKDRIAGLGVTPAPRPALSKYLKYETKTDLRLPFEGEWFVYWGGRTVSQNYHAVTRDQRFAYDILIMKDGGSHTGEGKQNEDYHCFELPVLAPGAGVVVEAVDGIPDNVPGEMNPAQAVGNHVIIDHGNGEYSFLAHFREGSLKVSKGQEVATGQLLGLCGNSGNTSEPHIHYHLQDTAVFQKGEGFPIQFRDYVADGKPVERGEPVRGQVIENGIENGAKR